MSAADRFATNSVCFSTMLGVDLRITERSLTKTLLGSVPELPLITI